MTGERRYRVEVDANGQHLTFEINTPNAADAIHGVIALIQAAPEMTLSKTLPERLSIRAAPVEDDPTSE